MRAAIAVAFAVGLSACGGAGASPSAPLGSTNGQAPWLFTPTDTSDPNYVTPAEPQHPAYSGPIHLTPQGPHLGVYNATGFRLVSVVVDHSHVSPPNPLPFGWFTHTDDFFSGLGGYIPTGALWVFNGGAVPWHGDETVRLRITNENGHVTTHEIDLEAFVLHTVIVD